MGLPAFDIGLTIYDIPPGWPAEDNGLENDVPGLGALFIAFSSVKRFKHQNNIPIKISATPSSSISKSSTQLFFINALHFSNHAA